MSRNSNEFELVFRFIVTCFATALQGLFALLGVLLPLLASALTALLGGPSSASRTERADGTLVTREIRRGLFTSTRRVEIAGRCFKCGGAGRFNSGRLCPKCRGTGRYRAATSQTTVR